MNPLRYSYHIIKRIFPDKPLPLGRWGLTHNHLSEIKGTLANIDSCADNKCGDPNTIKIAIDQITYKSHLGNDVK